MKENETLERQFVNVSISHTITPEKSLWQNKASSRQDVCLILF